ncbi:alpha/beta fold hydrolase [Pyxidicoccus sp. 3LG]
MVGHPGQGRSCEVHGIELHYTDSGSGAPLVLLHGSTGCGADWRHVFDLEALASRFRVLVPDLRGHGGSTNPGGELTMRQCALDTYAWLDALGIERFRAVGLSLGANTLLHMAVEQPARVEAMVLASATPYFPAQARALMAQVTEENQPPEEWARMRASHRHGDAQIRALWRAVNGFKDSYRDMNFTPPLLSRVSARTLLVAGDRDPLYPVELPLEMYRAIPRASLWVVPGGGHGPIFGEHRESFVRTALAFLTEPGTPG